MYFSKFVFLFLLINLSSFCLIAVSAQCENIDASFQDGGFSTIKVSSTFDKDGKARKALLTSKGFILAGDMEFNGIQQGAIAFFNLDGSVNNQFSFDGVTRVGKGEVVSHKYYIYDLGIQSSGKIIVGGHIDFTSNLGQYIARFNEDGSIDTSFGISGQGYASMKLDVDDRDTRIRHLEVLPNDHILVYGFYTFLGETKTFRGEFNENGIVEKGPFKIEPEATYKSEAFTATYILDDIVFEAKRLISEDVVQKASLKIESFKDGIRFPYFNGESSFELKSQEEDYLISRMKKLSDGSLIAIGTANSDVSFSIVLKFDTEGKLDKSFGDQGIVRIFAKTEGIDDIFLVDDLYYYIGSAGILKESEIYAFDKEGRHSPLSSGIVKLPIPLTQVANTFKQDGDVIIAGSMGDDLYTLVKLGCNDIVSQEKIGLINDVNLYPNPVREKLFISNNQSYSVKIYNVLGHQIHQSISSGHIDISRLDSGQYIAHLLDINRLHVKTMKFIKI